LKISLTICRQILFRNFKTGGVSIVGHSPSKGKDYFPLGRVSFPLPIVSPREEKVSFLSQILTIYSGICPFGTRRVSPGKRRRTFPSPIVSKGSRILSICLKIASKFTNRACRLSRTGAIAKGGDSPAKGKECMAKGRDTIREVEDGIGEGIVRICDQEGGIGEGVGRIGVVGDRICEGGGGKGEGLVPIGEGGERISIVGDGIGERRVGISVPFVCMGEHTHCHSEQKRRASE
jgi:hypothetical protein